ncbi:MAG: glycosyltransferase [Thermoguttaceae bacterium]|jgi:glycosyltransferase involved in cell wall biosynthesis
MKPVAATREEPLTLWKRAPAGLRRLKEVLGKTWRTLHNEGPRNVARKVGRKLHAACTRRRVGRGIPYGVVVSVILLVEDGSDGARLNIESILSQKFHDFELLLACDGSLPEAQASVNRYASHPRVRILRELQMSDGPADMRNRMIALARGKYIAIQDSHDIAEPDRLSNCVRALERGGADAVYDDFRGRGEWQAGEPAHAADDRFALSSAGGCDQVGELRTHHRNMVMARSSLLRLAGGYALQPRSCGDQELWVRLAQGGYRLRALSEALASVPREGATGRREGCPQPARWKERRFEACCERGPLLPRVAFLLPCLDISGGTSVVLQYAHRLSGLGHQVSVLTVSGDELCDWFPYRSFSVLPLSAARAEMFDCLVATFWTTAGLVARIPAEKRFYFVQSDESRFYPGDERLRWAALATYELDLELITIAKWLQRQLEERFGRPAHYLPNGIDPTMFHPADPVAPKGRRPRVLLEGPIDIPFKGMKNAFQAVAGLDCEVWCASSAGRPQPGWRCDRFFQKVPQHHMKHIYSSCDIFLKMSEVECFFLPPLEMMACGQGACVLGDVTGIDEYGVDGVNALVVERGNVNAARNAVQRLMDDAELRRRLIAGGLATARQFDWDLRTAGIQEILCCSGKSPSSRARAA